MKIENHLVFEDIGGTRVAKVGTCAVAVVSTCCRIYTGLGLTNSTRYSSPSILLPPLCHACDWCNRILNIESGGTCTFSNRL